MNNILEIKKLEKTYRNGTCALKGVDLAVEEGTVHALIGPNGAGKTTMLKSIMNFIKYNGQIKVMARPVNDVLEKMSYVSEEKSLYRNMKTEKFIKICNRLSPTLDTDKLSNYISRFKIPLNKKISTLSSGLKTSLSMAIGLSQNAEIYLFDEPTQGLDPVSRVLMMDCIRDKLMDGKTVFYTSHIISEVEQIADSISIIYDGRILHTGLIDDIKENYLILYVNKNNYEKLNKNEIVSSFTERDISTVLINNLTFEKMENKDFIVQKSVPTLEEFFLTVIRGAENVL